MEDKLKEILLKIFELSDTDRMQSAEDMQNNHEEIQELLQQEFPDIHAAYILENE